MNPYASSLAGLDPIPVIRSTAATISSAISAAPDGWMDQPWAPGKWTRRQVLAHLADTEIAFAFRLRQAMADPHHVIQPFDQDAWSSGYANTNAASALAMFTALRQWNVEFIAALTPADFDRPVTHPERGTMTIRTIVETMAGHDRNHLAHFTA
jgi:hypothetical protein